MTAGGENESMVGIDLVNLRRWSETHSPKLGQTGRKGREEGRGRSEDDEGGRTLTSSNVL